MGVARGCGTLLCLLVDMTAVKTSVGLLYRQSDAEICKQLKTELTTRCSDIEIRADVAVENIRGGLLDYR